MTADQSAQARMRANGFAPFSGNTDERQAHAAEYTAFYLGEITRALQAISASSSATADSSIKMASSAAGVAHIMANGGR